ncbi:MAG: tetratricopeptide repeat protein, partial [Gemmatimonadota bacterium]
ARRAYLSAAPALRGREATAALSLATLLGRVSPEAARAVGSALTLQDRGDPGGAVDRLAGATNGVRPEDRAPLLSVAAAMAADAGLPADARRLRSRIVADHPRSSDAPAALLALGRELAADPATRPEARELIERLILEYPRSALVPQARRVLERLDRSGTR